MKGNKLFFLSLFCLSFFLKAMVEKKDQLYKLTSPKKEVEVSLDEFNALRTKCGTIKNLFDDIKEEKKDDESTTTIPANIDPTKVKKILSLLVLDDIFAIEKELERKPNKELLEIIQTVNYLDCDFLLHKVRDEIIKRFTKDKFLDVLNANADACSNWYEQLTKLPLELRVLCGKECRLHKPELIPQLLRALSYSYKESVVCQAKEDSAIRILQYSPDGSKLLIGYEGTIEIRDIVGDKLKLLTTLHPHKGPIYNEQVPNPYLRRTDYVNAAAFAPKGTRVATSATGGLVKIWNLNGECMDTSWAGHLSKVCSIDFAKNWNLMAIGYADSNAIVCTPARICKKLEGHKGAVSSVNFSPRNPRVVTGSADNTAKIWNLEGECETTLKGHTKPVLSARFSPDDSRILTCSADNTAKIWNLEGECKVTLPHEGVVYTARFSPDGSLIITGTSKGEARIWNLRGHCLAILPNWGVTDSPVWAASFSPDGSKALTVARKQARKGLSWTTAGVIKIWDLSELQEKYKKLESFFKYITIEQVTFLLALNKTLEPKRFWPFKNKIFDYSQGCLHEIFLTFPKYIQFMIKTIKPQK